VVLLVHMDREPVEGVRKLGETAAINNKKCRERREETAELEQCQSYCKAGNTQELWRNIWKTLMKATKLFNNSKYARTSATHFRHAGAPGSISLFERGTHTAYVVREKSEARFHPHAHVQRTSRS
jgi:hypothetical protein